LPVPTVLFGVQHRLTSVDDPLAWRGFTMGGTPIRIATTAPGTWQQHRHVISVSQGSVMEAGASRATRVAVLSLETEPSHADRVWMWLSRECLPAGVGRQAILVSRRLACRAPPEVD
jgi:hypothetical protein